MTIMCVFIYTLTLWYIKVDRTLDIKEMGNAIRKFATMRLIIRLMSITVDYFDEAKEFPCIAIVSNLIYNYCMGGGDR